MLQIIYGNLQIKIFILQLYQVNVFVILPLNLHSKVGWKLLKNLGQLWRAHFCHAAFKSALQS